MSTRSPGDTGGPPPPALPERYVTPRLIAVGGMGTVWRAQDATLGRTVAIKLLAESFSGDPGAVRRFMREARAAAHLSGHANVVTIYDVGECDERPCIVMEYLAGGSVADALRLGAYSRPEALRWIAQAAAALDFAHARSVVHRDVKPANMLLSSDRTLHLADFGIASLGPEQTIGAGELFGTAAYLAPEQAKGCSSTAASDRYALAVAAFELLTGERPFAGDHFTAQARAHIEDPPPSASARVDDVPGAADAVLARGMAKDPDERWPTAVSFAAALAGAMSAAPAAPAAPAAGRELPASRPGGARKLGRVLGEAELAAADPAVAAAPGVDPSPGPSSGPLHRRARPRRVPARVAGAGGRASRRSAARRRPPATGEPPLVIFDSVARVGAVRGLRGPAGVVALLAVAALTAGIVLGATRERSPHPQTSADRVTRPARNRRSGTQAATTAHRTGHAHRPAAAGTTTTEVAASASEAPVLEARGHALMEEGDYAAALPVLREAVAIAPRTTLTYAYALFDLGRTLALAGRPREAIPILEARLKIPNQPAVVRQELAVAEAAAAHPSGTTTSRSVTSTTTTGPSPTTPSGTTTGTGPQADPTGAPTGGAPAAGGASTGSRVTGGRTGSSSDRARRMTASGGAGLARGAASRRSRRG